MYPSPKLSIGRTLVTSIGAVLLALAAVPVLFASPAGEHPAGDRVLVVATTNIVGDIVGRVGGELISLSVLMPPGADPHTFQPTPRDAHLLADAAVLFTNGAGLEAEFLGDLISSAEPRMVVDLTAHLPLIRLGDEHDDHDEDEHDDHDEDEHDHDEDEDDHEGHAHHHGEFDPHVWMDPTLVARWADEIAEVLAGIDPAHEAEYAARANELGAELDTLDAWIMDQVEAVPRDRRVIVTDHDVMGYFAQRYGFELLDSVVPGFSTVAEPSARHLAELREVLAEHAVPAIFVGTTVNPQMAESIAADLGIAIVPIYTGSLSEAGGPADTYDRFMRTNVERIVTALGS
ncbi:MAG: metal ABC transporter substrate-binding protein [Spirochaetaceae bacterium]|nr:metal ABC transporter substrate-binding protein [Spirochaetaceae bacterium]